MSYLVMRTGSPTEKGSTVSSSDDNLIVFRSDRKASVEVNRNMIFKLLKQGHEVIWEDAPPSLNERRKVFNLLREESPEAYVLVEHTFRTLEELEDLNKDGKVAMKDYYLSLQPPRVGVDCDSVLYTGTRFFKKDAIVNPITTLERFLEEETLPEIKGELKLNFAPHDSPYHKETIDEHINTCIELSRKQPMKILSLFHDLGKGVAKSNGRFIGHENVGAVYLANAAWCNGEDEYSPIAELIEAIQFHMVANGANGVITEKVQKKYSINEAVVKLIEYFVKNIDQEGRK